MVAGNVDVMFGNMPEFLGQIAGGNLIPICFGGTRPSPLFANLPMMTQWLPDYIVNNWFAIFGPRGLPGELSELWNKALRGAVAKAEVQKRFVENGIDTLMSSSAELKATIAADRKKWQEIIISAGMRAD
jgi:tripartite-type tricarboxylate transporter receptor subunit TctC